MSFFLGGKIEEGQARAELSQPTKTFFLFLISVDGIRGKEAQVLLANLSQLMAIKIEEPIFHIKV